MKLTRQEPFRRRLVFLEDYGMAAARYLVQGCDVWLNTPRRPRAANGVLNLSILDGVTFRLSGLHGYTVRVLPHHPNLVTPFLPGLIAWASGE